MTQPQITEQEWKDYHDAKERFEQLKVDLKAAFEKSGFEIIKNNKDFDIHSDYLRYFSLEYKGYMHPTDLHCLILDVFDIE